MPLAVRPVADSKFYVSTGVPASFNAASYAALTWTEVTGLDQAVSIGLMRESGNFDALSGGRQKYRTILDSGDVSLAIADLPADAGQTILQTAFNAAPGTAAEKLSLRSQDSTGLGTYGRGSVVEWRREGGGSGDIWMRQMNLLVDPDSVVEY